MAKIFKNSDISGEALILGHQIPGIVPESSKKIQQQNEEPLENIRQEAYRQGYLSAKKEAEITQQELAQLKQQVEEVLCSIPKAIKQNRLELAREIADIILLITQQLFIQHQADANALAQQINRILTQLNNQQTITLYLHPQEINALHKANIQLEHAHFNELQIKGDTSLALGGFVIKTSHGIFDASIEKQIDKLKDVLLQIKHRGCHASLD